MELEERVIALEKKVSELETYIEQINNQQVVTQPRPAAQYTGQQQQAAAQYTGVQPRPAAQYAGQQQQPVPQYAGQQPQPTAQYIGQQQQAAAQNVNPQKTYQNARPYPYVQPNQNQYYRQQPKQHTDLEQFIGKNISVIIASVLIFIGVIVFASVFFPYLTTELKFILMCVASVGFTVVSYYFVNKHTNNLTVSLLACGLGTVYITLFTGNLYFKVIPTIILFALLVIWILAVYFCSKYKSILFNIIGQAGIILSLVLCTIDALVMHDGTYILYATAYVLLAEILYEILFREQGYLINTISIFIIVSVLSFPVIYDIKESTFNSTIPFEINRITVDDMFMYFNSHTVLFLIMSCMFLYAVIKNVILAKANRESALSYSLINFIGLFSYLISLSKFEYTDIIGVLLMLYGAVIFILTERVFYYRERETMLTILSTAMVTLVLFAYYYVFDTPYISALILLIPLAFYIYKTQTKCNRIVFYISLGVATFFNCIYAVDGMHNTFVTTPEYNVDYINYEQIVRLPVIQWSAIIYYISCVIFVAACYILLYRRGLLKNVYENVLMYLFVIGNVLYTFICMSSYSKYSFDVQLFEYAPEVRMLCIMALALGIQLLFRLNGFFQFTNNMFKQTTYIVYFTVNAIIMLISTFYMYRLDDVIWAYIIGTILYVTLFTINTYNLLRSVNELSVVYVGLKITVLIFIVLHIFDSQPVISIFLFLWAIACIIIGQKLTQKPLRIYALILALISAVKLILVDISYATSLSRAFSFIICGLLCFVISFIYTRVEKNQKGQ